MGPVKAWLDTDIWNATNKSIGYEIVDQVNIHVPFEIAKLLFKLREEPERWSR